MRINEHVRNWLIILVLAALVVAVPGGGTASSVALQAASLAFLAAIAWVASRMYREHRMALYSLGDRRRAIVYAAVGVATLTLSASARLLVDGTGTVVWLLLLGGAAYAVFAVFRAARNY
jgi:hypothetical protein